MKIRNNDFIILSLLLSSAFLLVYFLPVYLNKILFLLYIPFLWNSKKDYLWLAFLLILLDQPGGFFSGGTKDDLYRLPIYSFAPGFSINFIQIFILTFFAKFLLRSEFRVKKRYIFFSKELKNLAYLFVVLILVSLLLGISIDSIKNIYFIIINLTLLYSIFYIIPTEVELKLFLRLIFPFCFIALLFQVYGLTYHQQPIEIFKEGATKALYSSPEKNLKWERPIEMSLTLFISFSGSLVLLGRNRMGFKKSYLILINAISFFSIFFTGTRSWITGFLIAYLYFFIVNGNLAKKKFPALIVAFLVIYIVLNLIPAINNQMENAWSRISTIEYAFEGDLSLGGTAGRYENYVPRIMEGFTKSSVLFGAGFSDLYFNYENIHIGYHNLLFNIGFIGIIFFLSLLFKIFRDSFWKVNNFNSSLAKLTLVPLIILLIINTGVQTIGYGVIHSGFFLLQAITLSIIAISFNFTLKTLTPKEIVK